MTNEEIIKALKENMTAYDFMPEELQDKADEIDNRLGCHWEYWTGEDWMDSSSFTSGGCQIHRLRDDYTEEPDTIELEIKRLGGKLLIFPLEKERGKYYTNAPALCPKEGYRFAGYRYDDKDDIRNCPVVWLGDGRGQTFPTHAVYRRIK